MGRPEPTGCVRSQVAVDDERGLLGLAGRRPEDAGARWPARRVVELPRRVRAAAPHPPVVPRGTDFSHGGEADPRQTEGSVLRPAPPDTAERFGDHERAAPPGMRRGRNHRARPAVGPPPRVGTARRTLGAAVRAGLLGTALLVSLPSPARHASAAEVRCEDPASVVQAPGLVGPEDIEIDRASGYAYVSSNDRRAGDGGRGALFRYRPGSFEPPEMLRLEADSPAATAALGSDLRPHGISLYDGPCTDPTCAAGAPVRRLFVINHRRPRGGGARRSDIEVFDLDDEPRLRRVRVLPAGPDESEIGRGLDLNDLVAVGSMQLYATDNGVGTLRSSLLGTGAVVHHDGSRFHAAASGLRYANGIAHRPDTGTLYVATSSGRRLRVYDVLGPGELRERGDAGVELDGRPDNLAWEGDERRSLLAAAHDSGWRFVRYRHLGAPVSPSSVWRVELDVRGSPVAGAAPSRIYRLADTRLPGVSIAAVDRGRVLLGAVFADRLLDCGYGSGSQAGAGTRLTSPRAPVPSPERDPGDALRLELSGALGPQPVPAGRSQPHRAAASTVSPAATP